MKESRFGAWLALIIGTLYFVVPLIGTFEFSLRMRRGVYSFDAYRVVLSDPRFQASFGYSTVLAVATIIVGVLLVVPTAYWVQLRLPRLRPVVEFITLLLFANSFGAIATAYGLTGSSLNIITILLYAQIRGDVLHNQNLGYALALGMILITALSNGGYIWLSARSERMRR